MCSHTSEPRAKRKMWLFEGVLRTQYSIAISGKRAHKLVLFRSRPRCDMSCLVRTKNTSPSTRYGEFDAEITDNVHSRPSGYNFKCRRGTAITFTFYDAVEQTHTYELAVVRWERVGTRTHTHTHTNENCEKCSNNFEWNWCSLVIVFVSIPSSFRNRKSTVGKHQIQQIQLATGFIRGWEFGFWCTADAAHLPFSMKLNCETVYGIWAVGLRSATVSLSLWIVFCQSTGTERRLIDRRQFKFVRANEEKMWKIKWKLLNNK